MKKKSSFIAFLGVMLIALTMSSCAERINAGYEGIKVNLYGSGKGVDSASLVTGMVWYNPFTTVVYEYPTFVQTVDYPKFSINAKGGSAFEVDPTISLKIIDGQSAKVFKKYRKEDLTEVINTTLYNYVKNAFRIELNKYTPEELVSKREEFEKAIEDRIYAELEKESFRLEQLTTGLKYPESLTKSINDKEKAVQDALKAENEVKKIEAEAKKRVVQAQGEAEALKIKGDAEAAYNRKISASLSSLIIQQEMVKRWDGKTPVFMGQSGVMLDANKFVK